MTTAQDRVEVARVGADHLPALAEFYRATWNAAATTESVRDARDAAAGLNPVVPGEAPPTWIVLQGGRAIAHVTTIPIELWMRGRERGAYWIKGLWVLPEFQRSSAGFLALRAAVAALEATLALVHEPAAIRLFQALGYADLGALPNHLRVLRPRSLLTKIDFDALGLSRFPTALRTAAQVAKAGAVVTGPLIGAAASIWAAVSSGRRASLRTETRPEVAPADAERLWQSARTGLGAAVRRGGHQLAERYGGNAEYVYVHVRARDDLVGLGIVKRPGEQADPRLRGVRVATLSDLIYRPEDSRAGLAILRGAERAARELGADALLCSATAPAIRSLLRKRAFIPVPPNLHVLARFPGDAPPPPLGDWWVTRADSGSDGGF